MNPPLEIVPMEKFRTTLASLRSQVPTRTNGLSELPIRVVPSRKEPGCFEVVDGFKRLQAARDSGIEKLTVVVEDAEGPEAKALLLRANASAKTLTPMDEARVVASLVNEDTLTIRAAAKLLKRRQPWASKRYALARKLPLELHRSVDEGRLPVSVAYGLTAFRKRQQIEIARVILKVGLSATNSMAVLATYRSLEDEPQRRRLLRDPLGTLQEFSQARPPSLALSSVASRKLGCYRELSGLLEQFSLEPLPETISPAERRLLVAERSLLQAKIICFAQVLSGAVPGGKSKCFFQGGIAHGSRDDQGDSTTSQEWSPEEGDRQEVRHQCKDGAKDLSQTRWDHHRYSTGIPPRETRSLQRAHCKEDS